MSFKMTHATTSRRSIRSILKTKSGLLPVTEDYVENYVVVPPDGGWGWFVVFIAFLCNFLIDGTSYAFGIFLNDISKSFDVHPTKIALASSIMNGLYYFAGPLTCALTNHLGFRIVAMLGGLFAMLTFIGASYVYDLSLFIFVIGVIGGTSFNMVYTPCILVVGFYFERWRALATAISVTGTSLGIMSFPPFVTTLLKDFEWREKFRILSAFFGMIVILALAFRPIAPVKVVEDKKTISFAVESDNDSIGTFHIEDNKEPSGCSKIFQRFHNLFFPTVGDITTNVPSITTLTKKYEGGSVYLAITTPGDDSGTRSFVSRQTDNRSTGLSVVYENDDDDDEYQRKCCASWRCCHHTLNRPLYRDDIFFVGSVRNLPEYQSRVNVTPRKKETKTLNYHMSVSRIITQRDIAQTRTCVCCPESFLRVFATMLHCQLLKSISFSMLTISGVFTMIGVYTPFVFMVQRGMEIGLTEEWSAMLITILGISNTVGRILCGVVSSIPKLDALCVSWVTTVITGAITIASCYLPSLTGQIVFTVIFGVNIGIMTIRAKILQLFSYVHRHELNYKSKGVLQRQDTVMWDCIEPIQMLAIAISFTAIRSAVITDLLGLENLTNAFGLTIMFNGIASFSGVVIAGLLQNYTGQYMYGFLFSGCSILFSGLLLIPIKYISKWEASKKKTRVSFK